MIILNLLIICSIDLPSSVEEVLLIMTAEIDEIRKRWKRLRVCNVCSTSFRAEQGNEES